MTTLTNSFEGGTSGTTISAANSGGASGNAFDTVSAGANTTLTFSNTHAAHGTLAFDNATGTTSTSAYLEWAASLTGTSITQVWYRAYCYYTANPTVQHRIVSALNGSTVVGSVLVTTAGKLITTNTAGGTVTTSTASIPLNQWFRIEGYFKTSAGGTTGQIELKLFSTADSATADETDTSAATVSNSTAVTRIRFGISAAASNVVAHWHDDLGTSDAGYIGPAGATAATATGAVNVTGSGAGAAVPVASGSVSLTGAGPAGGAAAASGAVDVSGSGSAALPGTVATGSVAVTGATTATAAGTASGSLAVTGAAAAAVPASATGSITAAGADVAAVLLVVVADMQPAQHTTAPPTVVAAQIAAISPQPEAVLIAGDCTNDGDNTGFTGEFTNFDSMYGGIKTILRPVPGNHDWGNVVGQGNLTAYDTYWGAQAHASATPPHFYSFDTSNGWHVVALDSDEQWIGSLANPSATYTALVNDLAANAGKPLIAYWHHPRWSDGTNTTDPGGTGDSTVIQDIWNLLYDHHCDLVFVGHCHSYQRFGKLGKTGTADPAGIAEFVVGTGGSGLFTLTGPPGSPARSAVNSWQSAAYDQLNSKWFGHLKLWLTPDSYSWQFISQNAAGSEDPGAVLDSGGPVISNVTRSAAATGGVGVSGSASAGTTPAAAGGVAVTGTSAARAATAATGSVSVTATGPAAWPQQAAGALAMSGSAGAGAASTATGSVAVAGAGTAAGPSSGVGSVTVTGAGASQVTVTGTGVVAVTGTSAARAAAAALAGLVTLAGGGTAMQPGSAAGLVTISAAGTGSAAVSAAGSLAITGTGAGSSAALAAGSLAVAGAAAAGAFLPGAGASVAVTGTVSRAPPAGLQVPPVVTITPGNPLTVTAAAANPLVVAAAPASPLAVTVTGQP